jgi:hypothetical protein
MSCLALPGYRSLKSALLQWLALSDCVKLVQKIPGSLCEHNPVNSPLFRFCGYSGEYLRPSLFRQCVVHSRGLVSQLLFGCIAEARHLPNSEKRLDEAEDPEKRRDDHAIVTLHTFDLVTVPMSRCSGTLSHLSPK